jgi:RimJ/RimL family protein N-acetyltransferase
VNIPEVTTERLLLRGFREEDFEPWAAIAADDEVMRAVGRENGLEPWEAYNEVFSTLGHWAVKGYGLWALEERATGELVGRAGLYYPPDWPEIEVGWRIARPRWGEGFAPEAGAAALRWAFDDLGVDHVVSLIADANTRSQRVAEKLGMDLESRHFARGEDMRVYGTAERPD